MSQLNEGCKHSEAQFQSDQPTTQTSKQFFAALNAGGVEKVFVH